MQSKLALLFDSGLGGTIIYSTAKKLIPDCCFYYVSDGKNFPYGNLDDCNLKQNSLTLILAKAKEIKPDVIVVACNTASTLILDDLRLQCDIPVVGVVPAIKTASNITSVNKITLLATPATIKRDYTHQLVKSFAHQSQVQLLGSSDLAQLAESKLLYNRFDKNRLLSILSSIDTESDVVVLGCTHFSFLIDEIRDFLNKDVLVIDSTLAIANRIKFLLSNKSLSVTHSKVDTFYNTKTIQPELHKYVASIGFDNIIMS